MRRHEEKQRTDTCHDYSELRLAFYASITGKVIRYIIILYYVVTIPILHCILHVPR